MFQLVCLVLAGMVILPIVGSAGEPGEAGAPAQSSYRLQASTMGAAGAPGESEGKRTNGTLSQPTPIGVGSAADKRLYAGFWPRPWSLASVDGCVLPGDIDDQLFQNSPNPFRSHTVIAYTTSHEGHVEIAIFDVRGRRVITLLSAAEAPGRHRFAWDGRDDTGKVVSPGVYFYRLKTGSHRSSMKMLKLR